MDLRTGDPITVYQAESSVFTWRVPNPLYFKIISATDLGARHLLLLQIRFNHNLRKALQLHKCYLNFRVWTTSRWRISSFCLVFSSRIRHYLDDLGAIGINNVIRAVAHAADTLVYVHVEEQNHIIKFNIY
ncbi:replication enhancer protein [Corchorus golden mosaic virus [Bangladesh:Shariatpur:2013]]|nr:replication enhancer protein [Corchorus golden mosaic virus [Bangladesh:Shariatpur:2013]]